MSDAPFQMLGLTASRDDRRLVSVTVPWNCKTLGETMTVAGGSPFGLPETGQPGQPARRRVFSGFDHLRWHRKGAARGRELRVRFQLSRGTNREPPEHRPDS